MNYSPREMGDAADHLGLPPEHVRNRFAPQLCRWPSSCATSAAAGRRVGPGHLRAFPTQPSTSASAAGHADGVIVSDRRLCGGEPLLVGGHFFVLLLGQRAQTERRAQHRSEQKQRRNLSAVSPPCVCPAVSSLPTGQVSAAVSSASCEVEPEAV